MLGDRIREARKKASLTQAELAEKIGVKRSVISKYENGSISPKYDTIMKIAEVLNVLPYDLYDDPRWPKNRPRGQFNIVDVITEANSDTSKRRAILVSLFKRLNEDGQKVAIDRISELTEIPRYQELPQFDEAPMDK